MIKLKNIQKSFGKQHVLKGINLSVGHGKIVSILGPNGSGKTTLMKSILGLVIPDKGSILIDGEQALGMWDYRRKIGYMPQIARFPENIRVKELISLVKNIRSQDAPREKELIELFEINNFLDKKLRNLSGGMRQKVNAAIALMFDTPILIIDEPTVGLDPYTRINFKKFLLREKEAGKTILFTSHILNEVEELSDEIVYILEGRVFFQGTLEELKELHNGHNLEMAIAKITKQKEYEKDIANISI